MADAVRKDPRIDTKICGHQKKTGANEGASGHQKKTPSKRSAAAELAKPSEVCEYSKDSLYRLYTVKTKSTGNERANLARRGLSYSEAVASLELKLENDDMRFPNGFWANKDTAEHMIQAALDRIPNFAQARKEYNIKKMAEIYRSHVINYEPKKSQYRDGGQMTFFKEHGLGGLINTDSASYLSPKGSAAALLDLAIPKLVDPENLDALQPYEILADFWNNEDNAKNIF